MLSRNSIVHNEKWPSGGIGRQKGLKIPRRQLRAGSSPASGTTYMMNIVYMKLSLDIILHARKKL